MADQLREEPARPDAPGPPLAGRGADAVVDAPAGGGAGPTGGHTPADVDAAGQTLAEAEAAVESDLVALQRERDDYLDTLRRLQADFDNFRKRTLKQQTDILERAAQALVEKLLPVLDAADLAVAHGGDVVAPVVGLLVETLQKEGLETVAPGPGSPFDPMVHEAVSHEAGDGGPQEVVGLLRAGYRWKGTLLRPAMVSVRG
jgi:molecular chaperone GrpE